jgi:hypothetical protein
MVIVVVPLPAVFAARRLLRGIEQACAVVAVFEHQVDVASAFRGKLADRSAQIVQNRDLTGFDDGVDRIEPQPVEAIITQPAKRIPDREGAHLRHAIIDRAAPWRLGLGEEVRRVAAEIVSLGAEMVIDHVQKHHQPAQMRFVDQGFQIVGSAIGAVGRVPQHAVITPAALAGKIRKRHQLERRDPASHQMIELFDHRAVATLRREGADMGFDQDGFLPRPAAPVAGTPPVASMIDHFARARHIVGLKRRGRIGHVDLAVDAEFVTRAGPDAGDVN